MRMRRIQPGDLYLVETYCDSHWAWRPGRVVSVKQRFLRKPLIIFDVDGFICDNTFGRAYSRLEDGKWFSDSLSSAQW